MLEQLEAASLFLIPLDTERRWYRYHHLFADVLRARLPPQDAGQLSALHRRAAGWYEAEGMGAQAIEHALAARDFELASRLIERDYEDAVRQGEMRTVERWLRALPPALIRSRPHLAFALASIHIYSFQPADAEKVLRDCRFVPQDDTPAARELLGRLMVASGFTARLQGEKERAIVLTHQALDRLAAESHVFRSGALVNLGILHEERGNLAAAGEAFAGAVLESQKGERSTIRLLAGYAYGQLRETEGALHEAARIYGEALAYAREGSFLHTSYAGLIYTGLGRLSYQRNDLRAAAVYLADGLERSDSAFADTDAARGGPCIFEMLRLKTALGDTAGADVLFERLSDRARATSVRCLDPVLAVLCVRRKDAPAAMTASWLSAFEARTAGGVLPSVPIPDYRVPDIRGLEIVTWAQHHLAGCTPGDETAMVEARLERFLEALVRQGRHGSALELRALLATLYWQGGHRERAVAVLEPALALAEREGYVRVFLEAGPALLPVLRQAAARGIAPEHVGKLRAALGEAERGRRAPPRVGAPALAEPLSNREMEVLRLVAAGLPNAEIATQLFMAVGTVRRHVHNLYGKMGVTSRTGALARARTLGLL
jgi:LuxR family maltose regulon positive regulatory protein